MLLDDVKIWKEITSDNDRDSLQEDLNSHDQY